MKARTIFMSLPKRKRYQSGEIPGVLDQGQGCSGARAGTVTVEWTKSGSRLYIEYRCHSVSAHASKTKLRRPPTGRSRCGIKRYLCARAIQKVCSFDVAPS